MKLKERNYLGFNYEAVKDKFGKDLEFICELPVRVRTSRGSTTIPAVVFSNPKPDRDKNHKDYMILLSTPEGMFVTGRDEGDMQENWIVNGVLCKLCEDVLVSLDRHDMHYCSCANRTMVDGGSDYLRYGAKDMSQVKTVKVHMRTKMIIDLPQLLFPGKLPK